MAQKIIGLDLGNGTLRVVTLQQGIWGLEGGEYHSAFFQNGLPPEESLQEELKHLLRKGVLKGESIVASIPGEEVLSRIITLPFDDPRKIGQVVAFEAESLLPMNLDELVLDHQILDRKEGKARVLVTAVPKQTVSKYIDWLRQIGIDPKVVEMDSMGLFNIARFFREFQDKGALLLDVGRKRSALCAVNKGQLQLVRTFLTGEEGFEAFIGSKTGRAGPEIRRFLQEIGFSGERGLDPEMVSALYGAMEPFIKELRQTLQAIEGEEKEPFSHLFVCGEGSTIPGAGPYLAEALGLSHLPVDEIGQPASRRGIQIKKKENLLDFLPSSQKGVYFSALGLGLKEVMAGDGSGINFRRGEFAYGKETQVFRRRFYLLGGLGFLILSLALVDLYLHYYFKEQRYQTLRSDLRDAYTAMFPNARNVVDEVQQTRASLKEMEKKFERFGSGGVTALKVLADMTSRIPEEAQIEVYDLVIDHAKIRLEAEAASFDAIDSIKKSFQGLEGVKDVVVSDARVAADKDRVKFRMAFELKEGI